MKIRVLLGIGLVTLALIMSGCPNPLTRPLPGATPRVDAKARSLIAGGPTPFKITSVQGIAPSLAWVTYPRFGNDGLTDVIVYIQRDFSPNDPGDIWYQRVSNGAPYGPAVQVTSTPQDDIFEDISGDYIVYTVHDSVDSWNGKIMLYQISTGVQWTIGSAAIIQVVRIHGTKVVWAEGGKGATQVMLYDLAWLGTDQAPLIIAGPTLTTLLMDIGERFVVWAQSGGAQYDILAYDLEHQAVVQVTNTPSVDESTPSTFGPLIAWMAQDKGTASSRLEARNMDTGQFLIVADNGSVNCRPSIDGDLICYDSFVAGRCDVFLYLLSTGETFQITTDPVDQYLNDVSSHMVAYVDMSAGNEDIFLATFTLTQVQVSLSPPLATVQTTAEQQFTATVTGTTNTAVSWSVNGVAGGNSTVGTVDTSGLYTAPTTVPSPATVTVTATSHEDPTASASSTVTIIRGNTAPTAEAGPDQVVALVGSTIYLDGSQSYDLEGDPLTYQWSFFALPPGSSAALAGDNTVAPTFVADVNGTYVVQLVVSDGLLQSMADAVTISFHNVKPVANAGSSQSAVLGDIVTLSGSGTDANNDPLTYQWSFVSVPAGSMSQIADPAALTTTFIPDRVGTYVAQLVANDGLVSSDPSSVQIEVVLSQTGAVRAVQDVQNVISTFDTASFKNGNMKNALINKLNAVIHKIQLGDYAAAIDQLQNDILGKTDGCATSGAPDKNDWITNCADQQQLYPMIQSLIAMMKAMQ